MFYFLFRIFESSIFTSMNEPVFGVITGDIVGSTKINVDYRSVLENTAADIASCKSPGFRLDFYRGDSFQSFLHDPADGLVIMLLLKAGLRKYPLKETGNSIEDALDARQSLGIGEISTPMAVDTPLGKMDGAAFVRSGRSLESMKEHSASLRITTGKDQLDQEFSAVCPLVDALANRWTINQAEAIYFYLLENLTQQEIGDRLGISQRGAGKRLEASNIEDIMSYNLRFRNLIFNHFQRD